MEGKLIQNIHALGLSNDVTEVVTATIAQTFASARKAAAQEDNAMTWGKHKGKTLTDIASFSPGYITWLKRNNSYLTETQKTILAGL